MTKPKARDGGGAADIEDLARRFQDLWREQLTAMAADPEFVDMVGKWMEAATGPGSHAAPAVLRGAAAGQGPAGGGFDPVAWLALFGGGVKDIPGGRTDQIDDQADVARRNPTPAGAAAATAPSRTGSVATDELDRRIAALEQRLERLEAALGGTGRSTAAGARKGRS